MAKKKQDIEDSGRSPLSSPTGQAWLKDQLALAEREEDLGPDGQGWLYNESLRESIIERAEFLRALVKKLEE